jgi:DNA repair exonuclease SbcCD ATPase subunit
LREDSEENLNLSKSVNLLDFLNQFHKIVSNNIIIISQFKDILQNLISIFRYNNLLSEKEYLLKEMKLSTNYRKSSDIKALNDLLKKLNDSISKNKRHLEFLQEDYLKHKMQIDNIQKKLESFEEERQELIKKKKTCFSEINKITREMSTEIQNSKIIVRNNKNSKNNSTNAEKIKKLQKEAKEIQFKIKNIKSEETQIKLNLDELSPIFDVYKNDYFNLKELIKNEEKRVKDLQFELKELIKSEENSTVENFDLTEFESIRTTQEIKENIEKVESELKKLSLSEEYYDRQNPLDFSQIIKHLTEFRQKMEKSDLKINSSAEEKEIYDSIDQFRELENSLNNIENFTNKFLSEINLKSHFRIIIPEDKSNFFINIKFIRKGKDQINFEELTTPEKVFFIIILYISVKFLNNKNNIIFSNISILSQYNKAGSIYRTIKKILPILESEKNLRRLSIIFIFSNLELKNEIENLKTINIKQS